ncbi:TPA: hypothetical protein N0F65_006600 [Lagenidium giganteum]|uniref:Uncharacterized protein n=1 Tax=Lagenidium giganteum TaxID=4803 RepID=A0AAV2ZE12_9STRA|nr:TPA: hypothetical protein N0F65_006600 [Lagenidium giganteum]
MEIEVYKKAPTSTEQLKEVLVNAWNELNSITIRRRVRSMPKRMNAVLSARGPTKY